MPLLYTIDTAANGFATVTFRASDILRLGSFTRIPFTDINAITLLSLGIHSNVDQPLGPNAPFNNVMLNWTWTEVFQIPGRTSDTEQKKFPKYKGPEVRLPNMP